MFVQHLPGFHAGFGQQLGNFAGVGDRVFIDRAAIIDVVRDAVRPEGRAWDGLKTVPYK